MAAPSRQQPNRRSLRGRVVDAIRATSGRARAAVTRARPSSRIRPQVPQQTGGIGKDAPGRLRTVRDRGVAGIRRLVDQSVTTTRSLPARQLNTLVRRGRDQAGAARTIPGSGAPAGRARTARGRRKTATTSVGRAAGQGPGAERAASTKRDQVEVKPATTRGTTRRTRDRQAKPRQVKPKQDLEEQTIQELREQARQAGIQGRSSMTKDQLIKALRDHPAHPPNAARKPSSNRGRTIPRRR